MTTTDLTIGDVLPKDLQTDYPTSVLNVPLSEGVQIAVYGEAAPTSDLSEEDIEDINEIFEKYQAEGGKDDGAGYWNKTPEENSAFWNKQ